MIYNWTPAMLEAHTHRTDNGQYEWSSLSLRAAAHQFRRGHCAVGITARLHGLLFELADCKQYRRCFSTSTEPTLSLYKYFATKCRAVQTFMPIPVDSSRPILWSLSLFFYCLRVTIYVPNSHKVRYANSYVFWWHTSTGNVWFACLETKWLLVFSVNAVMVDWNYFSRSKTAANFYSLNM